MGGREGHFWPIPCDFPPSMSEIPDTPESPETPRFGPERDRRRRKRLLTKRNVGITLASFLALFLIFSVIAEMRTPDSAGFGRLYSQRTKLPDLPERQGWSVVEETEITRSGGVDPLLLDSVRRQEILGVEPGALERQHGRRPESEVVLGTSVAPTTPGQVPAGVKISGGPEGVKIEQP